MDGKDGMADFLNRSDHSRVRGNFGSQVTVYRQAGGIRLLFDTQYGEVPFDLTEDNWKRLQDIVWQCLTFKGPFDLSREYHCGCEGD